MPVRLTRHGPLYAVVAADCGTWLAGFVSEANRALYLTWGNYEVVG